MEDFHPFQAALPVWFEGLETEKNITGGLYAPLESAGEPARLTVATAGFYRVFVNGAFVHYGPARCAHGFYRADELELELRPGQNHVAIEVVNYYINSYASLKQPGFIQAELRLGGRVAAATGREGFIAFRLTERVRKMQRFSFQRAFGESYRLAPDSFGWRTGLPGSTSAPISLVQTAPKALLPRRIALPAFPAAVPDFRLSSGRVETGVIPESYRKDRSLVHIHDPACGNLDGYDEDELELHLSDEVQEMRIVSAEPDGAPYAGASALEAGQFEILSLPAEKAGFPAADIHCEEAGTLYIMVDETLRESGDVDPLSMECLNVLRLDMQPGDYPVQAMEPLGFRYLKLVCTAGRFTIRRLRLLEVICPQPITARYAGGNPRLSLIFDAARETFLQNSTDIFMDCPTRERAGWLCDSFFSARAEFSLTGGNAIERNFLENYRLPARFEHLPEGMLPMCYPADHFDGNYIPNWAMWFVLELEDYQARTGDAAFVQSFHDRVYALLRYFEAFENADGLLEKLQGWVFLEWSHANELVQDINFPTNMLYARMLTAVSRLFGDAAAADKAERLRQVVRARSFNGRFFTDNEVYRGGRPVASGECTETCQYYAFFTDTATPGEYPELWRILTAEFGPDRQKKGLYPDIFPANAFIGNYLRLELLHRYGLYARLLEEIEGYFLYMAERTGTLWENTTDYASCSHGFASYAAALILDAEAAQAAAR